MTDPTEDTRREMIATLAPVLDLLVDSGPRWDTEELQRDFEVLGFMAPFVVVRRRSDGLRGSLEFAPTIPDGERVYFGWRGE
jgi:hypothetical protein